MQGCPVLSPAPRCPLYPISLAPIPNAPPLEAPPRGTAGVKSQPPFRWEEGSGLLFFWKFVLKGISKMLPAMGNWEEGQARPLRLLRAQLFIFRQ